MAAMLKQFFILIIVCSCVLPLCDSVGCQVSEVPNDSPNSATPVGYINWPLKTVGGMQFWTDWKNVGGWRVQENSETGHCRLLDPNDVRHAWGDFAHCQQELINRIANDRVQPATGQVVILLHGLNRSSYSLSAMESHLKEAGYATVNFTYASSRKNVVSHAAALKTVIDGLGQDVTDIHFVAHSLGNIVIRRYLFETAEQADGVQGDPRIRRIVMLGPPNQGSEMAAAIKNNLIFRTVAGSCGDELASGWKDLEAKLATPNVEFGIIAGAQDDESLSNPFVAGNDDLTVSVEETKLLGATDFLMAPLVHGTMMNQPSVLEATARFFKEGYFVSAEKRTPLIKAEASTR